MLCVNLYVKMMSFKIYTAWVVLFNHLSANPTKLFNNRQQPTNCLSVFDHFKGCVLKELKEWRTFLGETVIKVEP